MNTRGILTALFFTFIFTTGIPVLYAQQTPKKTPTTKNAAKKAVTKKKTSVKKEGNVFICDVGGYFYHSRTSCEVLKKCKGKVLNIPKQQASGQFSCKQCKKCY